jgi:hypothetical protein
LGDGIAAAKIEKRHASVIKSSGLGQTPQNLDRFFGRVSSYLIHADENGRVLGLIAITVPKFLARLSTCVTRK